MPACCPAQVTCQSVTTRPFRSHLRPRPAQPAGRDTPLFPLQRALGLSAVPARSVALTRTTQPVESAAPRVCRGTVWLWRALLPALQARTPCPGVGQGGDLDSNPAPDRPPTFSSARSTAGHGPRAWTDGGRGPQPEALRQCPVRGWSAGCCPAPYLCPGPREGQGSCLVSTPAVMRQRSRCKQPRGTKSQTAPGPWVRSCGWNCRAASAGCGDTLPCRSLTCPPPPPAAPSPQH